MEGFFILAFFDSFLGNAKKNEGESNQIFFDQSTGLHAEKQSRQSSVTLKDDEHNTAAYSLYSFMAHSSSVKIQGCHHRKNSSKGLENEIVTAHCRLIIDRYLPQTCNTRS